MMYLVIDAQICSCFHTYNDRIGTTCMVAMQKVEDWMVRVVDTLFVDVAGMVGFVVDW